MGDFFNTEWGHVINLIRSCNPQTKIPDLTENYISINMHFFKDFELRSVSFCISGFTAIVSHQVGVERIGIPRSLPNLSVNNKREYPNLNLILVCLLTVIESYAARGMTILVPAQNTGA